MAAPLQVPALSLGIMGGPAPIGLPIIAQPAVEPAQCGCSSSRMELPVLTQPVVEPAKPSVNPFIFIKETWSISKRLLPLFRAMLEGGMSQGAALAFLITGAGTSIGAIGGALTIARWRVIGIVIGTLWVGSILLGFAYNLLVM